MKAARFGVALAAGLLACKGAQVRPDAKLVTSTVAPTPAAVKPAVAPERPITPKDEDARTLLAEAKADFAAGRFADAKAAFAKLVEKQPDDAGLRFDLGLVEEKLGDDAAALKAYELAHRRAPDDVPSALNLARRYREDGRLDEAIAVYQQALAAEKNAYNAPLLDSLSAALRLKKDFAKAEAAAKKSLSRNKDDVEAYKSLALISFDQGNYRLAELLCANAKKVAPKDPGIFNDLGLIYLKQGETALALAEFDKAIALDPKFEPGYANIGAIALRYRDYQAAERAFSQAASLSPKRADLHLDLAFALDGQRPVNPAKGLAAAAEFEQVLALQPSSGEAICGAGWAFTADRTGFAKAAGYLAKCRALSTTGAAERSRIDAKLQALAVMMPKTPAPAAKPAPGSSQPGIGGAGGGGNPAATTPPAGQPGAKAGASPANGNELRQSAGANAPTSPGVAKSPASMGATNPPTTQAPTGSTTATSPTNVDGAQPSPTNPVGARAPPGSDAAAKQPADSSSGAVNPTNTGAATHQGSKLPAGSVAGRAADTTAVAHGAEAGADPAQPEPAAAGRGAGTR